MLKSLSGASALSSREVIDATQVIADDRGLGLMQVHVLSGMSALSRGFLADPMESLLGLLAELRRDRTKEPSGHAAGNVGHATPGR